MATLVPLSAIDPALVEELLDAAFGEGRHARTAYRIREGVEWLDGLSFAALDDEDYLAGTIQLWPVALTDPQGRPHPMIMVGPVAVMPGLHTPSAPRVRSISPSPAITVNSRVTCSRRQPMRAASTWW